MCTEKCFELKQTGSSVTRRAALVGGAAVAASAVMGGTASAGEPGPAFSHRRHGLRDLTYPLTTTFPAFAPGEAHWMQAGADKPVTPVYISSIRPLCKTIPPSNCTSKCTMAHA